MALPKYARRADKNESNIVKALQKVGAEVIRIGRPVDLLVGFRGRNYLLEVKRKGSGYTGTDEQKRFIKNWRGQVVTVYTPEEAVEAIT